MKLTDLSVASSSSSDAEDELLGVLVEEQRNNAQVSIEEVVNTVKSLNMAPEKLSSASIMGSSPSVSDSPLKPRSYQTEMVDKAMETNIIATMGTGSGKTLVAILRIQAELEKAEQSKRVWFLVPTLALGEQQLDVVRVQLPAAHTRLLSSMDKVDKWTEKRIWESALAGVQIVVSTPAVLYDALTHAFVRMDDLSLLVFDEAHHCTKAHSTNLIMQEFYHPRLSRKDNVPSIFGMTASPIINSKPAALSEIENNLNAISRAPSKNAADLEKYVHKPDLSRILFSIEFQSCNATSSVEEVCRCMNIYEDPYVIRLKKDQSSKSQEALYEAVMKHKTYSIDLLQNLKRKAVLINEQLGIWATTRYVEQALERLSNKVSIPDQQEFNKLKNDEKVYILKHIEKIRTKLEPADSIGDIRSNLSTKMTQLVQILADAYSPEVSCIVFAQQRVMVSMLKFMVISHPALRGLYNVGSFVGTSTHVKKQFDGALDLGHLHDRTEILQDFRDGKVNLIFATDVLEEGIDISACNMVICFDKPPNLKSFIQRRGRARKKESKFIIMMDILDSAAKENTWHALEQEMKRQYQDDMRQLEALHQEEGEDATNVSTSFIVKTTGAQLTFNNSISHLHHFCNKIPQAPYGDNRPEISVKSIPGRAQQVNYRATITLPNSVEVSLRTAQGSGSWPSRKLAKQDAAFQAYISLYHAGLVNENLLPLSEEDDLFQDSIGKRPSLVKCRSLLNPWAEVAKQWDGRSSCHRYTFISRSHGSGSSEVSLSVYLPVEVVHVESFLTYWDASEVFSIEFSSDGTFQEDVSALRKEALDLLKLTVGAGRFTHGNLDLVVPITFQSSWRSFLHHPSISSLSLNEIMQNTSVDNCIGVIYDLSTTYSPYRALSWSTTLIPSTADSENGIAKQSEMQIKAVRIPKRSDFIHRPANKDEKLPQLRSFSSKDCVVGKLPFFAFQTAKFIPSITHKISTALITQSLCKHILKPMRINNSHLFLTAITAPMACEGYDYQSLEFYGDSTLKFLTSVNIFGKHPAWHEGYLSSKKDRIVSNLNLANCCVSIGVDSYIIDRPFTGLKWRPSYVSDLLAQDSQSKERDLSTKILADVMESLLGASYVDGGLESAIQYLRIIIPSESWDDPIKALSLLEIPPELPLPEQYQPLTKLLPYKFNHNAHLLEALTHNTYPSSTTRSYQRLEFLGDAVLDNLITSRIFASSLSIPPGTLHLLKAAVSSHNFLAFLSFECVAEATLNKVTTVESPSTKGKAITTYEVETVHHPLWHFLRHFSHDVTQACDTAKKRYADLCDPIRDALDNGTAYPWTLLSQFGPDKFFSDIIESLLGAVYVDSNGDIAACEAIASTFGIFTVLDRLLKEEIDLMPPKNKLGQWASERQMTVKYESGTILKTKDEEGVSKETIYCKILIDTETVVALTGYSRPALESEGAQLALGIMELREEMNGSPLVGKNNAAKRKRESEGNPADQQASVDRSSPTVIDLL